MIKKFLLAGGVLATLGFGTLLEVDAGVGTWSQDYDGYVKIGNTKNYFDKSSAETDGNPNTGNFGLDTEWNFYFYAKVIHPLPILPNLRFQYTKYDTTGRSKYISGNVEVFGDVDIPTSLTNASTDLSIDSYDVTLFYQFSPVVADVELGVGVDLWDGSLKIVGTGTDGKVYTIQDSFLLPLPYLYGRVESMKFYGVSFVGMGKFATFSDNHHYDFMGAVKYTMDLPGFADPYIEVGYRYKDIKGVKSDNETILKTEGIFAEVGMSF
jgi:outer membrane protein